MSFFGLLLVQLDQLVDLGGVGAVVGDGGLDQAQLDLQVPGRFRRIAVTVADGGDDLPYVLPGADQAGTASARTVGEPD